MPISSGPTGASSCFISGMSKRKKRGGMFLSPKLFRGPSPGFINIMASQQPGSASVAKQPSETILSSTAAMSAAASKQATVSLSGATAAPRGSSIRQAIVGLSAALGFVSSSSKQTGAILSASLGLSGGALGRQATVALLAIFVPTGSAVKQVAKSVSSQMKLSASVFKQGVRSLLATLSLSASNVKQASVSLFAGVNFSGAIVEFKPKIMLFLASIGFSGASSKQALKSTNAVLSSSGTIGKQTNKGLSASTASVAISLGRSVVKAFNGALYALTAIWAPAHNTVIKPVTIAPISAGFGVSLYSPAIIATQSSSVHIFTVPNKPSVLRMSQPAVGTPNGFGLLGYFAMPGQILVYPGTGKMGGRNCIVVAGGDATVPPSGLNATLSFVLNQNYFSTLNGNIVIQSDPLAQSGGVSISPGSTVTWGVVCNLSGNAGNGILIGNYKAIVGGQVSSGVLYSNINPFREPVIQLSVGVQFTGDLSGSDLFKSRMTQFEIQSN